MKIVTSNVFKNSKGTYISHSQINGLFFSSNIKMGEVDVIGQFPHPSNDNSWIVKETIQHNDKLYFFSAYAFEVWEVEDDHQIKKIEYGNVKNSVVVRAVIRYKDIAWIFPSYFIQNIMKINLNTWEVEAVKWNNERYIGMDRESFSELISYKNKVYFTNRIVNHIGLFEMNLDTLELKCINLNDFHSAHCIWPQEKSIWVLGRTKGGDTAFIQYEYSGQNVKKLILDRQLIKENEKKIAYPYVINLGHMLIIPPYLGYTTIIINTFNDEVHFWENENITGIYEYCVDKENVYLFSENNPWVIILKKSLNGFEKKELVASDEKKIRISGNPVIKEREHIGLDYLINGLMFQK